MKKPPLVIKSFGSLPRNNNFPIQEFRVRVIKYENSPKLLDIREFITNGNTGIEGKTYTGYTSKGIAITIEQWKFLCKNSFLILEEMDNEIQAEITKDEGKS